MPSRAENKRLECSVLVVPVVRNSSTHLTAWSDSFVDRALNLIWTCWTIPFRYINCSLQTIFTYSESGKHSPVVAFLLWVFMFSVSYFRLVVSYGAGLVITRSWVRIPPTAAVYQRQASVSSLRGRLMSTSGSWGVNGQTTRCIIFSGLEASAGVRLRSTGNRDQRCHMGPWGSGKDSTFYMQYMLKWPSNDN